MVIKNITTYKGFYFLFDDGRVASSKDIDNANEIWESELAFWEDLFPGVTDDIAEHKSSGGNSSDPVRTFARKY